MDAKSGSNRQRLAQKLTAWALDFEDRRRFADLVSRHRFLLEEQQAAADWIYLRAEVLTRQQHPELGLSRREDWSRAHERTFHSWSQTLHGQVAADLCELGLDLAEREGRVVRYAARLGFRNHRDLIEALGLDPASDPAAANER